MTVSELIQKSKWSVISEGSEPDKEISRPFCCDLLSIAMSKSPARAAWVTVMGNMNTLAVAALTDAACVILADGITLDEPARAKAVSEGVTVLVSDQPIFETALMVHQLLS